MYGVRRSTTTRLLLVLVLVLGAVGFAGGGVSSATDPAATGPAVTGCPAPGTLPDGAAPPAPATTEDPGVAGPAGPLSCVAHDEAAADAPATTDPGPQAPAEPDPAAALVTEPQSGTTGAAEPQPDGDDPAGEPTAAPDAAVAPAEQPAIEQPAAAPETARTTVPRHRRVVRNPSARRRGHRRRHVTEASVYFPPVFVDWAALTPLAPPEFGVAQASRFPGPLFLLPIYQAAAVQYDVPWQILASINEIETNFGTNTHRSSAGAVGWMQFLPSTWQTYGVDANGDGIANPEDPVDAIFAAARYLHASGSVQDLGRALFSYNHANWYVARVLRRAVEIGAIPQDLLTSLTRAGRDDAGALRRATGSQGYLDRDAEPNTIGRVMLLGDDDLASATLADDRLEIYACGRDDIRAGVIDRRVLETVEYLAFRGLAPSVASLRCGHSFRTRSGHISEHSYGAALDIVRINGTPILGHQGAGSITDTTIQQLLKLGGSQRPHQIISLMTFTGAANTLALGDHDDHIHIGFAPVRRLAGS